MIHNQHVIDWMESERTEATLYLIGGRIDDGEYIRNFRSCNERKVKELRSVVDSVLEGFC